MYEAINGILKTKEPVRAVVETGGIYYRLLIPFSAFAKLPELNKSVFFYLSFIVREDSQTLYAFLEKEERDLFERLTQVSGIGPKTALGIVGHMEIDTFHRAILSSDTILLSKIPGIGKKTAERLIIEMRDHLKGGKGNFVSSPSLIGDAMQALINLGYNLPSAKKAIDAAMQEHKETDLAKLIASALRKVH